MEKTSCINKRKRSQNTAPEQYELYVETMENDYIFRSGTIGCTVEPNYIENKWKELTIKLNSVGKGPILSKETWQKRFKDWKNTTRAKFRKIYENRLTTGGGTGIKIELLPLEERGLAVWGKVEVTDTPCVMKTGGLVNENLNSVQDTDQYTEVIENIIIYNEEVNETSNEDDVQIFHLPAESNEQQPEDHRLVPANKVNNKSKENLKQGRHTNHRTINEAVEELKQSYDKNTETLKEIGNQISKFADIYKEVHTESNKTEDLRLKFEIAKFKYQNTDFSF